MVVEPRYRRVLNESPDPPLNVNIVSGGDIQVGAVEIKDDVTDLRANVQTDTSGNNRLMVDAGTLTIGSVYTVPPFTATGAYIGNQSAVTLITPASGKKLQIIGCQITSDDSLFDVKVSFATSGKIVTQHFEQGTLGSYIPLNIEGATNEVLTLDITDSAAQNWFFTINYAEID